MAVGRFRVLLVEDEFLVAELIEDMLASLDCELTATADRLAAAMAAARTGHFDLALLDLALGGVATYPVAELLRGRDIPFAFVTGRDRHEVDPAYANTPVLQKPFRLGDLAATIALLLPERPRQ
jgi:CheY-like chemotaxis protein